MSKRQDGMLAGFTAAERDFIRRELDMFFSTFPRVADGFQLRGHFGINAEQMM
jgi:hypothetical protein